MAQNDRARRIKNLHESNALTYGHFGTATYQESSHTWEFLRKDSHNTRHGHHRNEHRSEVCLIHQRSWSPNETTQNPASTPTLAPAFDNARRLLRQTPDASILSKEDIGQLSAEGRISTGQDHQPTGSVLDFGYARSQEGHGSHPILLPILAARGGGLQDSVQFMAFESEELGQDAGRESSSSLRILSLSKSLCGQWTAPFVRVTQIAFAKMPNRRRMLVRDLGGTTILQLSVGTGRGVEEAPTRLSTVHPNHVVTIPVSKTGGNPHTDAAFSPTDHSFIGLVDTTGCWSIWRIKKTRRMTARVYRRAYLVGHGSLGSTEGQSSNQSGNDSIADWHAICWLTDSEGAANRILVCSRALAVVFHLNGDPLGEVNMRLGPSSDGNQILQVQQGVRNREHVFVLTTSRLLLFNTALSRNMVSSKRESLVMICSWTHFRDINDMGLRMSVAETSQCSRVLLYSSSSSFATVYSFWLDSSTPHALRSQSPIALELPVLASESPDSIVDIQLWPTIDSPEHLRFIAATVLGRIVEAVYQFNHVAFERHGLDPDMHMRTPMLPTGDRHYRSSLFVDDESDEEFVVADGVVNDLPQNFVSTGVMATVLQSERPVIGREWNGVLDDHELQSIEKHRPMVQDSQQRFVQHLQDLRLSKRNFKASILSDLLQDPQIADLEETTEQIPDWLKSISEANELAIQTAGPAAGSVGDDSLQSYYEQSLELFVRSLSPSLTDRNRVVREKLARQCAADLAFSSKTLRSRLSDGNVARQHHDYEDPVQDDSLPVTATGSSQQSNSGTSPILESSPMARLGMYTSFKHKDIRSKTSTKAIVSIVLNHLPESAEEDPKMYSYDDRNKELQMERDEAALVSLDVREQKRLAKLAAKRQKALERQALSSQNVQQQRALLPVVVRSLGSKLPGREFQSSQPAMPESSQGQSQLHAPGLTMTQPEPGVYGVRPTKHKAKGKKVMRTAGF